MEKFKMVLLAVACLFMAGLNLWLEFKGWFGKTYQRKDKKPDEEKKAYGSKVILDERGIPDIVGKSKTDFKLIREQQKEKEERQKAEQARKMSAEEQNEPVHSMDLEKEKDPLSDYDGSVSSEDDIILDAGYTKKDAVLESGQSATVDEFNLLAKTLSGKITPDKQEESQVARIIVRTKGTDLYNQFIKQVDGAESRAAAILRKADELEENGNTSPISIPNNLSKFIRT